MLKQFEVQNIYIGEYTPNFATQGPCPDGFHLPLNTEWQAIYDIYTGLGLSGGNNLSTYLKLPMSGYRDYTTSVTGVGSYAIYRASSPQLSYEDYAYLIQFTSSSISPQSYSFRSYAHSIRGFKNTPIIPTSSWTKLYGTSIESGGIFWNSTDGLISLSSDGTTWITIQDKNLGATTVYNYGDTLTDANCGNVYQWGNNYGFPGTLSSTSITTSTTRVNAKNYGPGNYYTSSTFIKRTSSPYTWETSNNTNLRGGVDGNVPV